MATFTVRPEGIIRQPALTMPGNATGSEAACTSLTASQIRTLLSLGTADSPSFSGLTLSGDLLFNATNQYDIGNGTYDPRTVRAATSVLTPLVNNASAALTLGNSTYGVTVPGAATFTNASYPLGKAVISQGSGLYTFSGTIGQSLKLYNYIDGTEMGSVGTLNNGLPYFASKFNSGMQLYYDSSIYASDQSSSGVKVYGDTGLAVRNRANSADAALTAGAATFSGDISMQRATQGYIRAYATDGVKNAALYHDGTNGILSTSSGNLNLVPTGGTVAVTGGITASGVVSHGAYTVATLPAAGSNAGKMAQVTDSNVAASGNYGATVAAGGANRVKVFSDGTNWVIA